MRIVYTVMCSIACGYFLYLVFESPFINLGKAMFVKKKSLLPNTPLPPLAPDVDQNNNTSDDCRKRK